MREIAVFVTAHLVPDHPVAYRPSVRQQQQVPVEPRGNNFRRDLEDSLLRQRQ